MIYRLIGRPETHAAMGFQRAAAFDPGVAGRAVREHAARTGIPIFTAAYLVSAYQQQGGRDKLDNVLRLFEKLSGRFATFERDLFAAGSAEAAFTVLRAIDGFGDFLAYQVLVDLLYPLENFGGRSILPFSHDDWAIAGPGARRGLALLRNPGFGMSSLEAMRWLHGHQRREFIRLDIDFPYLRNEDGTKRPISLANIQNCLCEFHKYVKIGEGTGRGRRRFAPANGISGKRTTATELPGGAPTHQEGPSAGRPPSAPASADEAGGHSAGRGRSFRRSQAAR